MKRLIALLLAMVMCLCLVACGGTADDTGNTNKVDTDKVDTGADDAAAVKAAYDALSENNKRFADALELYMEQYGRAMLTLTKETFGTEENAELTLRHAAEYTIEDIDGFDGHFLLMRLDGDIAVQQGEVVSGYDGICVLYDLDENKMYDASLLTQEFFDSVKGVYKSKEELCLGTLTSYDSYLMGYAPNLNRDDEVFTHLTEEDVTAINPAFSR